MSEISSIGSYFDTEEPWPSDTSSLDWKKTAQAALCTFSSAAFCAGVPAAVARRRRPSYAPIGGEAAPPPVAVAAEEAVEPAQPAQQNGDRAPRCREEDARIIEYIYNTTANTRVLALGLKKPELDELVAGLRERRVHPFEILRRTPPEAMRKILREGSRLKVWGMFNGIREDMEREIATLDRYTDGLAADMGKSPERLRPLIQARDWRAVVGYLFDIDDARRA